MTEYTFRSYDEFREAMRRRKDELRISDLALDQLAGLAEGHSGHLLTGFKPFGPKSMAKMLAALRLVGLLREDAEMVARISAGERAEDMVRSAVRHEKSARLKRMVDDPLYFVKLGRRGGKRYAANHDAKTLSRNGLRASRARWGRHRARRQQAAPE